MKKILIIGGGLGGLTTAISLAREGVESTLIEKNAYPLHRVCGEYVSNEVLPFLKSVNLLPGEFDHLPKIDHFQLSACNGKSVTFPLDLGGFGISRYALDHYFYLAARASGVKFRLNTAVENVSFHSDAYHVLASGNTMEADIVVGAHGKRSRLDSVLKRDFTSRSSPYVAVKYHVRTEFPDHLVALHNFEGGYCGVVNVENGATNLCYLARRSALKDAGGIPALEEEILQNNPLLKYIFVNSDFLFNKPIVINEISFDRKPLVENGILMVGDAAGMITPLCGNGMAMAIHGGKLAAEAILKFCKGQVTRDQMESFYRSQWNRNFATRLWAGRKIQKLFGNVRVSNLTVHTARYAKPVVSPLIRFTHGNPF